MFRQAAGVVEVSRWGQDGAGSLARSSGLALLDRMQSLLLSDMRKVQTPGCSVFVISGVPALSIFSCILLVSGQRDKMVGTSLYGAAYEEMGILQKLASPRDS